MKKSETQSTLYSLATSAMKHAYNPYSQYSVGAALSTADGITTAGCNVENVSFRLTLCAEANAIGQLIALHGKSTIEEILIVASGTNFPSPCGACRQIIAEFAHPETAVHLARKRTDIENDFDVRTYRISALLPLSFTQASMTSINNTETEKAISLPEHLTKEKQSYEDQQ